MIKLLTKNWQAKLFCLIAAAGLWAYVSATQNTIGKFPGNIRIKTLNNPANLTAIYDTETVNIKIIAEPSVWQRLSSDSFSAYVDLSGLSEGVHELPVTVTSSVPGVQIVEKDPDHIFVRLEQIIEKEVPVAVKFDGSAAEGMVPSNVQSDPEVVKIKGPKSIISALNEITATVNLNGESVDFEKNVHLSAINEKGEKIESIEINPAEVKVKTKIIRSAGVKTIGIKVKTTGAVKDGYYISAITTDPETVDISGAPAILLSISALETYAIDLQNTDKNIESTAILDVKNGISLQPGVPTTVKVKIIVERTEAVKKISPVFNILNLNSSYVISSYDPSDITVTCSGTTADIAKLTNESINLNIDLASADITGSKTVIEYVIKKSDIKTPSGITVNNFFPTSIKITLTRK